MLHEYVYMNLITTISSLFHYYVIQMAQLDNWNV